MSVQMGTSPIAFINPTNGTTIQVTVTAISGIFQAAILAKIWQIFYFIIEIEADSSVVFKYDLVPIKFFSSYEVGKIATWTFSTILDNKANLTITVSTKWKNGRELFYTSNIYYFSAPATVNFAGSAISIPANTLKITVKVNSWPFKSLTNSLSLEMSAIPARSFDFSSSKNVTSQVDPGGSLQWYMLNMAHQRVYSSSC